VAHHGGGWITIWSPPSSFRVLKWICPIGSALRGRRRVLELRCYAPPELALGEPNRPVQGGTWRANSLRSSLSIKLRCAGFAGSGVGARCSVQRAAERELGERIRTISAGNGRHARAAWARDAVRGSTKKSRMISSYPYALGSAVRAARLCAGKSY
jgi:hypothetical protein